MELCGLWFSYVILMNECFSVYAYGNITADIEILRG